MTKHKTSLTEEDFLGIIDLQHRLVGCKNWNSLYACLKDHFLPFIDCDSMAFGWRDLDLVAKKVSNVKIIGFVGITREDADFFQKITPYCKSSNKMLLSGSRSVVACDIDIPWKTLHKEASLYGRDNPEYKCPPSALCVFDGKIMKSIMFAIDKFETGLGMAIHRLFPNDRPLTLRDVRITELVRPILFQTIKIIALSEELARHKSLAESLADIPTGVALVRKDMRVIFINKALRSLIPLEPGHKLPANLETAVKREVDRISNIKELPDTLPNKAFYKLHGGEFRLSIDPVNKDGRCYLLRLKPANDAFSQLNMKMQTGDLSNREKEICCLAKDGFTNEQIAERLFLSRHTVKTHMKHIYKKMGVQKRAKLVALLNRKD